MTAKASHFDYQRKPLERQQLESRTRRTRHWHQSKEMWVVRDIVANGARTVET